MADVDEARRLAETAEQTLVSVLGQLTAVGLRGSAQATAAAQREVTALIEAIAALRARGEVLRQQILGIEHAGKSAAAGPSASAPKHGPSVRSDPGLQRGALGGAYRAGVHDPHELFEPKERAIADWLATGDRSAVHPRPRDDTTHGKKNPDAMVRTSPTDLGTVTEFKTLDQHSSTAVKNNIKDAARQLRQHGNGHTVIDGRRIGLTAETARHGYARAHGEHTKWNKPMPDRVTFILGDGSALTLGGSHG